MTKTVKELIELLSKQDETEGTEKTAMTGVATEAQSPVGAAAVATQEAKRSPQIGAPVPMDVNTAQHTAGIPGADREGLKTRIMSADGQAARAGADADPEIKLNHGQDLDASGATAANQGPVGAQKSAADVNSLLASLHAQLTKTASTEEVEMIKVAEDMAACGRWMARGFWDELNLLATEGREKE